MNQPTGHYPQALPIKQNLPELLELYERYDRSTETLKKLADEAENFTVRLPLVGAFSCGKTSLINALIGEKLFAVEVSAETALPVELSYSPTTQFIGHTPEGGVRNLTHDNVLKQNFTDLLPDGWLQAKLPASHLQAISQLTLVDMPSWDSGIDQHSQAIDSYLYRSLAYCLVVSADEGNLRESLRNFIKELAVRKMPALVVITKSDKKPQEDIDAVQAQITQEVAKLLGQPPLGVVQVSATKRKIQPFIDLLASLQGQAGERFSTAITKPFINELSGLVKRLETLNNQDNLNEEGLQAQRKELEREMLAFEARVRMETERLDSQVNPAATGILMRVESNLTAQLGTLAREALNGGDIKGTIGTTLRLAISEGIQEEFAPKVQRYFERIEQDVPNTLNLRVDLDISKSLDKDVGKVEFDTSSLQQIISTILPFILTKLTGPIGLLVGGVASLFVGLFGGSSSSEENERDPIEDIKRQIANQVIPQVKSQVEASLRQHLKAQAEEAKQQILAATQEQSQSHQESLNQLEKQLQRGKAAFEAKRQEYQADQEKLNSIIKKLC